MDDLDVVKYFQAPRDYFWHWADNGKVIEFSNGATICYREDLLFILESLNLPRALPFSTFILLFYACKNDFESTYDLEASLEHIFDRSPTPANERAQLKQLYDDSLTFLKVVNSLSYSYRMGLKRIPLYQAIFEGYSTKESKDYNLKNLLSQFNTGNWDELIFNEYGGPRLSFKSILRPLVYSLELFPTKEALELKLRTGLTELPEKAEIALPKALPGNLFDILDTDAKTVGISRLARHIIGALSIPMHLSGSSDQSVGGVSDISNRGHYDKLLLRELAQDDLLLTARLANNEALFLQREELPVNNSQEWHILLDTTLKMWGLPRVFGLAAGLAFSEGRKKKEAVNAWALGGKQATAIDLYSKEGIITTLEQMDPALNCGEQLVKLLADQKGQKGKYIMITAAHYKEDHNFFARFLHVKDQLDYLVVVNRYGHIELFETQGGRHKLLNQATIDLDSVLFSRKRVNYKNTNNTRFPAMLQANNFPLFYPSSKVMLRHNHVFRFDQKEAVIITQDKRVLLWQNENHGAIELVEYIESGEYFWGNTGPENLYLLIKNPANDFVLIYQLDIIHYSYSVVQSVKLKANDVRFHGNLFYIKSGDEIFSIKPSTGERDFIIETTTVTDAGTVTKAIKKSMSESTFNQLKVIPHFSLLNQVKKFINNGYSVINSAANVYVSTNDGLFIDHRHLRPDSKGNHLIFKDTPNQATWVKPYKQEVLQVDHLPNIKFSKFIWQNGSEAVLDSRGMLHLKSADTALPEITVLLVIDKPTACWAADGKVTGSAYFTGKNPANHIPVIDFYDNYIQPFIDNLK